jgi:hypothetical protein
MLTKILKSNHIAYFQRIFREKDEREEEEEPGFHGS